jgi:4-amino-4-deoxy-L-arabinose transferase-like glycosyltransferase
MRKRIAEVLYSESSVLILVASALAALHIATNGQYGFHRDELQTLDDARHLDWGFVAYPPITPLIGRVELVLFGTSLVGFRFFSAIAVAAAAMLTGLMAKELGGSRHIQALATVAAGISPISLIQGAVFQYVAFDYLWGVAAAYFLVRLLKSGDPRWWLAVGAVLGLGMETRYTIGVLALGIAMAVLLTRERRFLRSPWLWAGVGLSILIFLPNLVWQARHDFISRDFLSYLHARDLRQGRYDGFLREQLFVCVNLATALMALLGLWFYLFRDEGRRYRLLGWTFLVSLAIFVAVRSRSYYSAPLYPMLLAAGSVLLGNLLKRRRPVWSRLAYAGQWAAIVIGGAGFALLALPVAPVGSAVWRVTSKV